MQVYELVASSIERKKTARAVAEYLGVQPQEVSDWRAGRRTCPPDMRARMAKLCGMDPREELAEAVAEGLSDTRRAGLLEALHGGKMFHKL